MMKGAKGYSKETILSINFSTGRSTRIMLMALSCFAAIMSLLRRDAALVQLNIYK